MDKIWFFEKVDLFDILCPHNFADFKEKHVFLKYNQGEYVYFPEDASKKIFLIAEGKVKIVNYTEDGKEFVKAILSKGEIFGELALFGEVTRNEFAVVITDNTVICPMDMETARELMGQDKSFSLKINKIVGLRIKRLERRIDQLLFKDVKTRVKELLMDMVETNGRKVGKGMLLKHTYTQKDIADLVGSTRQTVTGILNDFKKANLINFSRKRILIHDLNIFMNSKMNNSEKTDTNH